METGTDTAYTYWGTSEDRWFAALWSRAKFKSIMHLLLTQNWH